MNTDRSCGAGLRCPEGAIVRRASAGVFGAAAALLMLLAGSPASAQFACTTTPTDITCTNSATAAGVVNTAAGTPQNATTINSGTNIGGIQTNTLGGGNATGTNSGSNAGGVLLQTLAGGNATGTNSGSNVGGFTVVTFAGGNANAINSGSNAGGFVVSAQGGGNAIGTNAGSNTLGFSVTTFGGGNATGTNIGSNTGSFLVMTNSGGNATGNNFGSNTNGFTVLATAGNATGTNAGSNVGGFMVQAIGGNALAINTGFTTGTLSVAAFGGTSTLTNSGTIGNFGGTAIQFFGGPDTLNLLTGSTIIGAINLVGANDTVNFLSGNHNLTFNTLAGASVNGPDPFVVSGNRAVAIDPTPFGLADRNLMDFTRGISGILDTLGASAAPNGPLSSAFAPIDSIAARADDAFATLPGIPGLAYAGDDAVVFKNPTMVTSDGRVVWARGFGGERVQHADGGAPFDARTTFLGGAVGFDMVARPDLRLGLFAGGGESRMSLDGNLGFTNTDTAFGGLYGRWGFTSFGAASFLDFALHGGASSNATSRTVNNNTLPGGIEIATASYTSTYISPDLKYGMNLPLWTQYTLTPSVSLRYVAGFFGAYTESGTTAPLTVASRTIQDFEERGELKLTRALPVGSDFLLASVHVGVIGLERAGDTTVNAALLGVNLPFVTPGRSTVGGVVGGGSFEWRTREGVSIFGAAEAIGFSDQSTVIGAKGGIRVAF